jgi:hypothetical protein
MKRIFQPYCIHFILLNVYIQPFLQETLFLLIEMIETSIWALRTNFALMLWIDFSYFQYLEMREFKNIKYITGSC